MAAKRSKKATISEPTSTAGPAPERSRPRHQGVVISYLRYSSSSQGSGDSIRRQLTLSEQWAESHGLTIDQSLRDEGVSAFRGANAATGALASILRRIERKEIPEGSTLIVESLDRLSRNALLEALELFISIIRRGVRIVTISDGFEYTRDNTNLQQLMYSLMILSRGHEESAIKSHRSKENWKQRRERAKGGELLTKKLPAWLRLNDRGSIEIDKPKARVVRYVFDLALKGYGVGAIVRRLNAERIPTFVKGEQWYGRFIWRLFNEGAAIGIKQVKRFEGKKRVVVDSIPNYYPPVVSEDVYRHVQTLLASRRNRTYNGQGTKYVNIFSGLLKDEDGHSYTTFRRPSRPTRKVSGKVQRCNGQEHRYLVSMGAFAKRVKRAIYLRQDLFEQAFFEVMLNRYFDLFNGGGNENASRAAALEKQAELDRLERQIAEVEEVLPTMKNPAVALRAVDKLETEAAAVREELKLIQSDGQLTTADQINRGLERMREFLTGEADNETRIEIGGIVAQLVKVMTLKLTTPKDWLQGECVIEARSGERLPFTFRYPHKTRRATVSQLLASLEVETETATLSLA